MAVSQPKPPVPSYTVCIHTGAHRAAASCPCSSCGLLPPALGQWVQAEQQVNNGSAEAQAQLLRVWGGKKLLLHLSKDHFWMSERSCVCTASLSLLQGGFVSWRPVECHTAPGAGGLQCAGEVAPLSPAPLSQSLSSEDEQVTHPPPAVARTWQVPSVQLNLLAERISINFCRWKRPGSTPFP